MTATEAPKASGEATKDSPRVSLDSTKKHGNIEEHELMPVHADIGGGLTEEELFNLRQRYSLLADASPEKLYALNKAVLKKLDWRFLVVITLMLLMK